MNNQMQSPSFIEYPDVNISLMREAAHNASAQSIEVQRLFIQTGYLPSLHTRIVDVNGAILSAVFDLRELSQTTSTQLRINTNTLKQYQTELVSADDSDREEVLEDVAQSAARVLRVVSKAHAQLLEMSTSMKQPVDRVATRQYLAHLADEQKRLPTEILEIQERMTTLVQQRQTLTEAMALIEARSFAQVGKDTMLNAQEISKLAMAGPEVAVVEKAIELAQQLMQNLEKLVNYFGLMDARNTVRKQLDDLLAQVHEKTGDLRLIGMKGELISACHNFDDHRDLYVAEFEKLILANQSLLSVHRATDWHCESSISELVADARALADYLKAVA